MFDSECGDSWWADWAVKQLWYTVMTQLINRVFKVTQVASQTLNVTTFTADGDVSMSPTAADATVLRAAEAAALAGFGSLSSAHPCQIMAQLKMCHDP